MEAGRVAADGWRIIFNPGHQNNVILSAAKNPRVRLL
jgi:hypothetical protein